MRDPLSRAVRKEELRAIFEPKWRLAVQEMESSMSALAPGTPRELILDKMLGMVPKSLIANAAEKTISAWEREDMELMCEIAQELATAMKELEM